MSLYTFGRWVSFLKILFYAAENFVLEVWNTDKWSSMNKCYK